MPRFTSSAARARRVPSSRRGSTGALRARPGANGIARTVSYVGRRRRLPISALLVALTPLAASAVEPSRHVKVTWPELAAAVDRHPRLASSALQVAAARGAREAAGAIPNPTLEASAARATPTEGGESGREWSVSVSLPLSWIAQRGPRVAAEEAGLDAVAAEGRALRREVLLQLRALFWDVVTEQARLAALEALEGQTRALVQTVGKRVTLGEARPIESTRVELELEKATSEVEESRTRLAARRAQLGLWLGAPPEVIVEADAELATLPAPALLEPAARFEPAAHPTAQAASARVRALESTLSSERRARFPALSVSAFASDELDSRRRGLGVSLDLPLWNWGSGRVTEAEARLAAGRKDAEATALALESDLLEARAECQSALDAARRLRASIVPRAESVATTMEKTYQVGEASLLELIDARRTLLDARWQQLGTLARAQLACSRLETLFGEEAR